MLYSLGTIVITLLVIGLASYLWTSCRQGDNVNTRRSTISNRRESVRVFEQLNNSASIHSKSRELEKELAAFTSSSKMNDQSQMSVHQPLTTEQVMRTLLDQARVFLAQGHPSKALSCVLAAVRHQRGEVGVFEVLNETREAHGLRRLAVPLEVTNSPAAQLPTGSFSFSSQPYHRSLQSNTMSDDHMDDSDGPASRHPHSSAPALTPSSPTFPDAGMDPADVVESLFRKLGVVSDSTGPDPSSSSSSAASFARRGMSNGAASSSSSSSSSSYHGAHHFNQSQAADDFNFEVDVASTIAASAPAIHYPSLRTQLPSLSANPSSGTSIQLMHEEPVFRNTQVAQNMSQPFQPTGVSASAFPAAASSAPTPSTNNDPSNSLPLLSVAGRDHILDSAYDDEENVSCTQCGALIPRRRFAHHLQYWCQTDE